MQGQQLKINKIFFLTYPIISFTLGRRLGMAEDREELVGGTHPWLVACG
jgi:hypothetical protein